MFALVGSVNTKRASRLMLMSLSILCPCSYVLRHNISTPVIDALKTSKGLMLLEISSFCWRGREPYFRILNLGREIFSKLHHYISRRWSSCFLLSILSNGISIFSHGIFFFFPKFLCNQILIKKKKPFAAFVIVSYLLFDHRCSDEERKSGGIRMQRR